MSLSKIKRKLRQFSSKQQAKILQRFFKTGRGEYAQGDIFIGVRVPVLRKLAKCHQNLAFNETLKLLRSPVHEERLLALLILILKYRNAGLPQKEKIFNAYLKYSRYINNWDLVDVTAKHIVGNFLADKDRKVIYELAGSDLLWERRIAIVATAYFIGNNDFKDTLKIAEILICDPHDLIHKAVGWMLREVGKKDIISEEKFLNKYCSVMPRTMLRYAIERFTQPKRQKYLQGKSC
ncbi:MAG: DNA alkylation repair protein [Candidatus Omnitrophica bacterium]|nr:DNA alkylation repair protein [Candidatus Omnitrophota bacterium]